MFFLKLQKNVLIEHKLEKPSDEADFFETRLEVNRRLSVFPKSDISSTGKRQQRVR